MGASLDLTKDVFGDGITNHQQHMCITLPWLAQTINLTVNVALVVGAYTETEIMEFCLDVALPQSVPVVEAVVRVETVEVGR